MTVLLAIHHREGLVLASDSQATFDTGSQPIRDYTQKLGVFGTTVGWGGSGETGLLHRIQRAIEAITPQIEATMRDRGADAGVELIFQVVNPLQKQALLAFVPIPGQERAVAGLVLVGYAAGSPYLYAIEVNGSRGPAIQPYFAMGSADAFAFYAMRSVAHFTLRDLSQTQALALAYRTIENTISTAAFGVGGSIQLLAATPTRVWCLSPTEVAAVADIVNIWKTEELRILRNLAPGAGTLVTADPPVEEPPRE